MQAQSGHNSSGCQCKSPPANPYFLSRGGTKRRNKGSLAHFKQCYSTPSQSEVSSRSCHPQRSKAFNHIVYLAKAQVHPGPISFQHATKRSPPLEGRCFHACMHSSPSALCGTNPVHGGRAHANAHSTVPVRSKRPPCPQESPHLPTSFHVHEWKTRLCQSPCTLSLSMDTQAPSTQDLRNPVHSDLSRLLD